MLRTKTEQQGRFLGGGVLDIVDVKLRTGIGFLRSGCCRPSSTDVYISQSQIRRFDLRTGDFVIGQVRPPKKNERYFGMLRVEAVNGLSPEQAKRRPHFENFTPIPPNVLIDLENEPDNLTIRLIDMVAPIERGQRGLIVSPPGAGATTLIKSIANAIPAKHSDIRTIVLIIAGRPGNITGMKRSVETDVLSSKDDEDPKSQIKVAELALERAKRLVESQQHVVVLVDSISKLAQAYRLTQADSKITDSATLNRDALAGLKRFFGAARNLEGGRSLTIIAVQQVQTGLPAEIQIYGELRAMCNVEIYLSKALAEAHLFPAIDVAHSWTHREDLLIDHGKLPKIWLLRHIFGRWADDLGNTRATEVMLTRLGQTKNNEEFLNTLTATSEAPMKIPTYNPTQLHRTLSAHLDLEEFRTLCFEIQVDYDSLPGEGKDSKMREFVLYLQRRWALDDLVTWLRRNRRDIPLDSIRDNC